jgi:hypothetical protein
MRDGVDILLDPEGREIAADAIPAAALADARSIISDEVKRGEVVLDRRIDVEDSAGHLVHSLEFENAVAIVRGSAKADRAPVGRKPVALSPRV